VLEQLLKLQTAQFGENSVECVSTTIYIAKALQQQYKNKQALVKCESALNMLRKIPNKSFADDIKYSCLIAMMYAKLGKNADSEKILTSVLTPLHY
jgi:hypothetical protein